MTHEVSNKRMVAHKIEAGSANGLESYVRPVKAGPFEQGTFTPNDNFDQSKYLWYIKRDTSNPGTYFIYYKDEDGKTNHYLTQHNAGTALQPDTNSPRNFKFVSFIYDNQEVLSLVVDKEASGYRYMGWAANYSAVSSIHQQASVYSNIYLHKLPIE